MRAIILSIAALALAACTTTVDAPTVTMGWECSPDASSRYRVDDEGMKLELCSSGCFEQAEGAICSG